MSYTYEWEAVSGTSAAMYGVYFHTYHRRPSLHIQVDMNSLGLHILPETRQAALSAVATLLVATPRCLLLGEIEPVD
jgi:hypothetical protein